MLAAAAGHAQQRHVTNITFQQADAETLPFPAQTFDVVTCRMGVMLFPHVAQALREIARVLKPEGRVAFIISPGRKAGMPRLKQQWSLAK
jgi:ubiquinone/menaquinone biosynthesis C-methylase UbiE